MAGDIIGLVSDVEVTPSAFAFLVDHENRNLSSLARAEDQRRAQPLIEAVVALELNREMAGVAAGELVHRSLPLQGEAWRLLYATSRAGMVFGIGVPEAEVDAVLAPHAPGEPAHHVRSGRRRAAAGAGDPGAGGRDAAPAAHPLYRPAHRAAQPGATAGRPGGTEDGFPAAGQRRGV